MELLTVAEDLFCKIDSYLKDLDSERYQAPLELFSGSSIGQHTRHIIEFFQCMLAQQDKGVVNYAKRVRNHSIESDPDFASQCLSQILKDLYAADLGKPIQLASCYSNDETKLHVVESTLERELVYNIEHAVHHMAMIKIGLRQIAPEILIDKNFGVAQSTVNNRVHINRK